MATNYKPITAPFTVAQNTDDNSYTILDGRSNTPMVNQSFGTQQEAFQWLSSNYNQLTNKKG